eukprot:UN33587
MNLHHWTWLFEFYGYHKHSDLVGLKSETVKKWCFELELSDFDMGKFKSLLDGEQLPEVYRLCEFSYLRSSFIKHYYKRQVGKDKIDTLSIKVKPMKRVSSKSESDLEDIANSFCDIVCEKRKSRISNLQLECHIQRYITPRDAVKHASELVKERSVYKLNGNNLSFMSTWSGSIKFKLE